MTLRMKSAEGAVSRLVISRLLPGSDLMQGITEVCKKHGILNGTIVSCIGSLKQTVFLDPIAKPELKAGYGYGAPITAEGPIEIISVTGTVCHGDDAKVLMHLHASLADSEGRMFGGHLVDEGNIVLLTADVVIGEIAGVDMVRKLDEETGILMFSPTPIAK